MYILCFVRKITFSGIAHMWMCVSVCACVVMCEEDLYVK